MDLLTLSPIPSEIKSEESERHVNFDIDLSWNTSKHESQYV